MVAPECCNRKRQYDRSFSPRPIHNIGRLKNRLGCVGRELNRKRPLVASGSQTTHKRPRTESGLSCRQSLPQGQGQHCGMSPHRQHYSCNLSKQQRGTRSPPLGSLTLEPWQWCVQKSILNTAQHLPGKLNGAADRESRTFHDCSEWQIGP